MSEQDIPESNVLQNKSSPWRVLGNIILWGALPLVLGIFLASRIVPQPAVGIVRLNYDIWSYSAEFFIMQLEEARQDARIKAVVVQMDSPGGEVVATQNIYFELLKLRQEMPVVGSIGYMAASGGYYVIVATEPIYAMPSSTIGNVGVWGYFPEELAINDVVLASGPFKLTASNTDEFLREIEGIKQEFLGTVISQRGERLNISTVDLSQGLAYPGREALRLGMVDYLGSQTEAIEKAAEMAGISNYEVIDLETRVIEKIFEEENNYSPEPWIGVADPLTGKRTLPPGAYLLYDVRLGSTR